MSKTTKFDDKVGSYGYYGGSKVKGNSVNAKGYLQTICILCPKKAIYHTGGDGYCFDHKANAINKRLRYRDKVVEKFVAKLDEVPMPETDVIEGFEVLEIPDRSDYYQRKR